ncbi:hypothetical protein GTU79_03005 [Sodalis ligni]|jgi:ribonuclease inhibitor|uniref:Ribonuclease inhibitor n=1 Tax=Sodalis ligni TaxID=2697027 RepID=A0A4R1NBW1_9GAMM|nr:hypothetical protein [Sodalis ligni]QWA11784.1 hypothetical protein GTU79_03005 [Sodalis ligni]TCL04832.1 ribonuclease inhibitor [Sodalis ligni]
MEKVSFDFSQIPDLPAFYRDFGRQFALSEPRDSNLDELWQTVTRRLPLPVEIEFLHLNGAKKRRFGALILLFDEAEEELEGRLHFNVRG